MNASLIATSPNRASVAPHPSSTRIEISKNWRFALDPKNVGRNLAWESMIPSDSTVVDAGLPLEFWHSGYDGVAWYWKEVSFQELAPGGVKLVRFEAVSYWSECWLNGHLLGTHEGTYDEFVFDLTPFHNPSGKNLLAVRVINPPSDREIEGLRSGAPLNQSDLPVGKCAWYYNFGGIWGRVWLESLPPVYLTDFWVDADRGAGKLVLRWIAQNIGAVDECVLDLSIRQRESGGAQKELSRTFVVDSGQTVGTWEIPFSEFSEWSIENPFLYLLEAVLKSSHGLHTVTRQFGFRDFRLENGSFCLNGQPVRLKGLLQQGAYPIRLAAPHSWRMGARELLTLKKAGFNFLRIHIKPAPDWYLDLADRIGILVMMEPPIGWIANGPKTEERIQREVKTLIRAHRSRASVVIWGIFNETFHLAGYAPGEMWALAKRMMTSARNEDETRMLIDTSGGYARASLQGVESMIHDKFRNVPSRYMNPRCNDAQEIVDVHVYCAMPPSPGTIENYRRMDPEHLPLFLAEFGAAEMPPLFTKVLATYSQQHRQSRLEDWQLHQDFFHSLGHRFEQAGLKQEFGDMEGWINAVNRERACDLRAITIAARRNPRLAGFCHCQLADASGELFGILDFWRRPKPAFHLLREAVADPAAGLFLEKRWLVPGEQLEATLAIVSDSSEACSGLVQAEIVRPDGKVRNLLSESFRCLGRSNFDHKLTFEAESQGIHEIRGRILLPDGRRQEFAEKFGVLPSSSIGSIKVSARLRSSDRLNYFSACGAEIETFGNNSRDKDRVVLLDWPSIASSVHTHCEILGQIRNIVHAGGVAIIFDPETPMLFRWLLPAFIGVQHVMRTSVYLKESPLFEELENGNVAGSLFASILGDRWDNADDVTAAGGIIEVGAFSAHMWTRPAEFFWGAALYRIPLGRGQLFVSHLKFSEGNPLACKVLGNLLTYAETLIQPGGEELLYRRCIDCIDGQLIENLRSHT